MRLGGPVSTKAPDPESWIHELQQRGYTAAYCSLSDTADDSLVESYVRAASEAGIVIAEVGAWSNPISPDENTRTEAIALCQRRLELADRVGARCCVNIAGSRADQWDGPHPDNLSRDTFTLIVDTVREIIDSVHPSRTYYALETMPWVFPNSADSYLDLIRAIDRERFAVHLDPVNLVCSPEMYFHNADLIRDCFQKLGPYIKSCHAKDVTLSSKLTVHLDETVPGRGGLDYAAFLEELNKLDVDTPLMLEHMGAEDEYAEAADYIRLRADTLGLSIL